MRPPAWLTTWATSLTTTTMIAMAVAAAGVLALAIWGFRRSNKATLATAPVLAIVAGTTIDGAIRFAGTTLGTRGIEELFPAVVFESVALFVGIKAHAHHLAYGRGPGRWGRYLIWIGILAGAIISTGATTLGGQAFRFVMPIIGAWLVVINLTPDRDDQTRVTHWRWTPTRFLIWVGARQAGAGDIDETREQVRRLTLAAYRTNTGSWLVKRWGASRLKRLALTAPDEAVQDTESNVYRALTVVERLKPETIAGNRQDKAETQAAIEAAKAETQTCRIAAQEAENLAKDLAARIAGLEIEAANLRQTLADTQRQHQAEIAAATAREAAMTERLKAAEDNRQTANMLRKQVTAARPAIAVPTLTLSGGLPLVPSVKPETVAAVFAAWSANQIGTQAEIAAAAGVSERTVRTVLKALRATGNPANPFPETANALPANGNAVI